MKRWQPFWLALAVASLLSLSVIWWESRPKPEPVKFGTPSEWHTYESDAAEFTIKYPAIYAAAAGETSEYPMDCTLLKSDDPLSNIPVVATILLDRSTYKETNLAGAWLSVAVANNSNESDCLTQVNGPDRLTLNVSKAYNDITWSESDLGWTGSQAMGATFSSRVFHTLHNDTCYEVTLRVAESSPDDANAGHLKAIDTESIKAQLLSIFYTFQFIQPLEVE